MPNNFCGNEKPLKIDKKGPNVFKLQKIFF